MKNSPLILPMIFAGRLFSLCRDSTGKFMHSDKQKEALKWWSNGFKRSDIPASNFTVQHSRSGGPGGQNVNKVSTRVEMRFALQGASWLPSYVKEELKSMDPSRVTNSLEYMISSCRYRTQQQNYQDCIDKLYSSIKQVIMEIPSETSTEKHGKIEKMMKRENEQRLQEKKVKSTKKTWRKVSKDF